MLKQLLQKIFLSVKETNDSGDQAKLHTSNGSIDDLLGSAYQLQKDGNLNEAEAVYRHARKLQPDNVAVYYLLARLLGQKGKLDEAEQLLNKAINIHDDFAEAYLELGNVYLQLKEIDKAIAAFLQALRNNVNTTENLFKIGKQLEGQGEHTKAKSIYTKILTIEPGCYPALLYMGDLYMNSGHSSEAIECYQNGLELDPDSSDLLVHLANAYLQDGNHELAEARYIEAIKRDPYNAIVNDAIGMFYRGRGDFSRAIDYMNKAVEIDPDSVEIQNNLGLLNEDLGNYEESLKHFNIALNSCTDCAAIHLNRALLNLKNGNFKKGWSEYHYRWDVYTNIKRQFSYPEWRGEDLTGKRVLIYAEQGIGDEILFASCIQEIIDRSESIVIECNIKLVNLYNQSFPDAVIHGCSASLENGKRTETLDWLEELEPIDFQVAIGALPGFFRNRLEDFPEHSGYLKADSERVDFWKNRLNGLGDGIKVGISWRGGTAMTRGFLRSIPLVDWKPILTLPGIHFVSLQYTKCDDELAEIQDKYGVDVHHWQEAIDDSAETAALLCALDRVVSIQTALVHLSGALGLHANVLVPYSPEWRYLEQGEQIPWYPSIRLYRQQQHGKWDEIIANIAEDIRIKC
ncbi:MAG: tetratricopeptide repeat protein [Gammaproteobacteria bacterium]|nr:MAG: tetratricopeptide repeat protein [Gammaproteobacteria bacterium]